MNNRKRFTERTGLRKEGRTMKRMKKLMALVIAVALVLAMGVSVFAADHTVTAPTDRANHTYEIYQVFTGTVKDGELTNLKYGLNAVGTTGNAVSQTDMTALDELGDMAGKTNQEKIEAMSPYVNLNSTPIATVGKGAESSVSLPEGYYVIKDTDNSLADPDTYTLYIFKLLDADINIEPKDSTTESHKNIGDTVDASNKITDTDIGKSVPYVLTVKLPSNYADYKDFYLDFVDDMSKGLTLDTDSVKIHYGASDTTGSAITFSAVEGTSYDGGQKYEYKIADLKSVAAASELKANDIVWVTYTATVNSDAVVGEAGNPNKFHVDYSNNPNETGDGHTNSTPDETNIVLTFKTVFNKVDPEGNALTGADFKLEKKVGDAWVDVTELSDGDTNPSKTGDTSGSTFSFTGLGQGDYRLTETDVPKGYNEMSPNPVGFTISATYSIEGDAATISALTGTELDFTPDTSAGSLTADILNQSGAELPTTGGMGTTIFYIVGAILVIGGGILLISKRRMHAE